MPYQGHLPDGSSVQKHSAGSCYPFIVYGQETDKGLKFGVMGPTSKSGVVVDPLMSCEQACNVADKLAHVYHRKQALGTLQPMKPAAVALRYPDAWGVS